MSRTDMIVLGTIIGVCAAAVIALWQPAIRPALEYLSGEDAVELPVAGGGAIVYHNAEGRDIATLRVETVVSRSPYRIRANCTTISQKRFEALRRAGEEALRYFAETVRLGQCAVPN